MIGNICTCHRRVETSYSDGFLSLKKRRNRWGGVTFAAIPKNQEQCFVLKNDRPQKITVTIQPF